MRLLGAVKMLAAAADPFLPLQHEICELRGDLLGKEFQKRDAQQEIDLNILPVFGALKSRVQQVREMAFPGANPRWASCLAVWLLSVWLFAIWQLTVGLRKKFEIGVLADEFEKVHTRQLNERWAKENVVMDIVHADGQRAER